MNDELILALYPRISLAKNAKISVSPPNPADFSIGHIVNSKEEVNATMERAEKAGLPSPTLHTTTSGEDARVIFKI
jgi:uncharacterized protein